MGMDNGLLQEIYWLMEENLTHENGPKEEKDKPIKKQIFSDDLVRNLLFYVLIAAFLISLSMLIAKLYAYHKEDKVYNEIRASVQSGHIAPDFQNLTPSDTKDEPDTSKNENEEPLPYVVFNGDPDDMNSDGILKIYADLKAQNDDLVGWITMPGFKKPIDYPVMQYFDNDYYMTHDFYKNKSNSGSIFMDAANLSAEPDRNIVIYGHAMRNNSMFGNLRGYPTDEEKYGNITTIYLDLLYTRLEYKVFSAYSTEADFDYRRTVFSDDEDFMTFLNIIKSRSEHDFGVSLSPRDKIITLSTCDKSRGDDGRIAIHAKLVKQIVYDNSGIDGEYAETEENGDKKIVTSNVYLEKLQLQYVLLPPGESPASEQTGQNPDAAEPSGSDTTTDTETSPAPGASPTPAPAPASSTQTAASEKNTGEMQISPNAEWNNMVLSPPFNTANALFSAKVPSYAAYARITLKPYDEKVRISYTVNDKKTDPDKIELTEGENVIIVHVLSADGLFSRKYTINVLREPLPASPAPQPEQTPETISEPPDTDSNN